LRKADLTARAIAGFVDCLLVIGLSRLPDVIGFLAASGYILMRDSLLGGRSLGKKAVGLRVSAIDDRGQAAYAKDSIIRNIPLAAAYGLFMIPYAGWILGPLALGVEWLTAMGDEKGMRIGDLLAGTCVVMEAPVAAETEPRQDTQPEPTPEESSVLDEGSTDF
jgi:uncharacterized RDD family membrane protein YckC